MPGFSDDTDSPIVASGRGIHAPAAATVVEELDSRDLKNRDIRQRGVLPAESLKKFEATVVGVGAIGHEIARKLACTGLGKVTIWDHDTVGAENLSSQGFTEKNIGTKKTTVVRDEMKALNSGLEIDAYPTKLRSSWVDSLSVAKETDPIKRVLFVCVDTMESRVNFYNTHRNKFHYFIDTRMSAEILRVLAFSIHDSSYSYKDTFFTDDDAVPESCTSRSLNYASAIAAGVAMHRFTQIVRGHTLHNDFLMDLNAGTYGPVSSGFSD